MFGNSSNNNIVDDNLEPLTETDPMDVLADDKLIFDDDDVVIPDAEIGLIDEDSDIGSVDDEDEDSIIEDVYEDRYDL